MLKKNLNISWQRIYALGVLMLFAAGFLERLMPLRYNDIYSTYLIVLVPLLLGMYISRCGFSGPADLRLYLIWPVWALLTRWLNGDIYLFYEFDFVIECVAGFLFLSVATVLDRRERGLLLDIVSFVYVAFFAAVAFGGLFVFITNTYIHVPPEDVWFTMKYDGQFLYPNYLSSARLHAAPRFLMALALLAYQFFKRKNKLMKVLLALLTLLIYCALALCHSRTSQFSLCAMAAMLGVLAAMHFFAKRSKPAVFIAGCLLAAASLVVCYKGFDLVSLVMTKAHDSVSPAFEEFYSNSERQLNPDYFGISPSVDEMLAYENSVHNPDSVKEANSKTDKPDAAVEKNLSAVDNRKLIGNWSFTERVEIWVSGLVTALRNPSIALKGLPNEKVAPIVNPVIKELFPYVKEYKVHMHNAFMQALMVTGVPGLLLLVLWTVLVVIKMLKVFFCKLSSVALADKILTLPLAGFFVCNLAENLLFGWLDISSYVFYIAAGCLIANHYELFPSGKNS